MKSGEKTTSIRQAESEALKSRAEVAPEQFLSTKCAKALSYLDWIGFTSPLRNEKQFHGRSGDGSGSWFVDKNYQNGGNASGNNNFQKINALNTSDFETAKKFARNQTSKSQYIARKLLELRRSEGVMNGRKYKLSEVQAATDEIYRITSTNPQARIIDGDFTFSSSLHKNDVTINNLTKVVRESLPSVFEACPLEFDSRDKFRVDSLNSDIFKTYAKTEDFAKRAKVMGLSNSEAERICRAVNTRKLISERPIDGMHELLREFLQNKNHVTINGERVEVSQEYFTNYLRSMGIVGIRRSLNSGRNVDVADSNKGKIGSFKPVYFFDMSEIDTKERNEERLNTRNRIFGKIALRLKGLLHPEGDKTTRIVNELEKNLYASPHELVEKAKQSVAWAKYTYEKDAGNWENYTLQEHTETTLRIFDDNFADKLPAKILPAARLALLVHDLGKPASAEVNSNTKSQYEYNSFYAARFMKDAGVSKEMSALVLDLISSGMHNAGNYAKDQGKPSLQVLRETSKKIAKKHFGEDGLKDNADGVFDLLMCLQTCDSGAYTRMARTRRTTKNGQTIVFRNHGTFDKSFEQSDLSSRRVSLRRELERRVRPIL